MLSNKWYNSSTHRVEAPEGTVFVTIIENDNGKPIAVDINIGKAGSTTQAWAKGMSRVITTSLENGTPLEHIIADLSTQNSDRVRLIRGGVIIRSGADAVGFALMEYKRSKYVPILVDNDDDDDDDDEQKGRFIRRVAR